jgi:large subunit ribosomal protein L16
MLLPKRVKFRKWHKPRKRNLGVATRFNTVAFGGFGLKAVGHAWINSRQIEAARRVLTRYVKRGGKIWIRVFPDRPMTKKGAEVPMGGGKGSPDHYVATVKPGAVLFEMDGIAEAMAREALLAASHKLSVECKFVKR